MAGPRAYALIGSSGGMLWDSQVKAELVNSNPKEYSFGVI